MARDFHFFPFLSFFLFFPLDDQKQGEHGNQNIWKDPNISLNLSGISVPFSQLCVITCK